MSRNFPCRALLTCGVSLTAILSSDVFAAGDAEGQVIEEILVTAQKRSESIQDVPISITAFDANFAKRVNLDDVKDLVKFSPGFAGNSKDSFIDFINIRGISTNDFGIGGDPSAGFFKDGLYQGRNGVVVTSLFDIERAEVLRGPQGFLFGRNAISGAISLHTAKPDFENTSGYAEAGFGERGIFELEGALNLPVSENFALRVAAYHSEENGYVDNIARPNDDRLVAHDKSAFRVTAALRGDRWDATIGAEYEDREQSGTIYRAIAGNELFDSITENITGAQLRGNARDIDSDLALGNFDNGEILSFRAEVNIDLGFATLTSLTGFKDHTYQYAEDFDGLPIGANAYVQDQEGDYFEQELRLIGEEKGPFSWYAGVSYYNENIEAKFDQQADEEVICNIYYYSTCSEFFASNDYPDFTPSSLGLLESNQVRGDYKGWGAYVDFKYAVSETVEFGLGLRYSKDIKNFGISILPVESELGPFFIFGVTTDGFDNARQTSDALTPRFVVRYTPNDDWSLYASATRGYKSGGFGSFAIEDPNETVDDDLLVTGGVPNAFNPESVWSYEIGAKANLFGNRLRFDVSAYHYRYRDLQLSFFDNGDRVANIGRVKAWGVETSAQAVIGENFDLYVAASFNHNSVSGADEIAEDSDNNTLPGSPDFVLAGVLQYHRPVSEAGEINASIDFRTQTSTFGGLSNIVAAQNDGWADFSLRFGYESYAGWAVTAYIENLFDAVYFDGSTEGEGPIPHAVFGVSRPRTYGVKLSYKFGE